MGNAAAGNHALRYLPNVNVRSTNSTQIYAPSVTTYTSFEGHFISVSSLKRWSLAFCLMVDHVSLPLIGHCRDRAPFGHIGYNIAFCKETGFLFRLNP